LKVFGSKGHVFIKADKRKLDDRSWKGIFMGYEHNGYRFWDPIKKKHAHINVAVFEEFKNEDIFGTGEDAEQDTGISFTANNELLRDCVSGTCQSTTTSGRNNQIFPVTDGELPMEGIPADQVKHVLFPKNTNNTDVGSVDVNSNIHIVVADTESAVWENSEVLNVTKTGNDPVAKSSSASYGEDSEILTDVTMATSGIMSSMCSMTDGTNENNKRRQNDNPGESSVPRKSSRIRDENYLKKFYSDYILNCHARIIIPNSFKEINDSLEKDQWENAIQTELDSLSRNETWALVNKPEGRKIVGCKWVFSVKNDEFGNVDRFKARLVAQGYTQEFMVDYTKTFAPVARLTSFRVIIALANQFNYAVHHMDVKTAFLNGKLDEEIYMKVPQGLKADEGKVCRLKKSIYGLKQAAYVWHNAFDKILKEFGFESSDRDKCIYVCKAESQKDYIYLVLYVDDLIISTGNLEKLNDLKSFLMNKFEMVDLGEVKLFLGIKVHRDENTIYLSQETYIDTVLERFGMKDCHPNKIPLQKPNYDELKSEISCDAPTQSAWGCLMYIMLCTRPDISIAVNIISRYAAKNNKEVWQCIKGVLRYLKGTRDLKLKFTRNESYEHIIHGYADSDYIGGDLEDPRSTSGFLFKMFDSCLVHWSTQRQECAAVSTTEAEFMALFAAVQQAMAFKYLLTGIGLAIEKPIKIFEDNQGCISLVENEKFNGRTKHMAPKYFQTRKYVKDGDIALSYIVTGDQLADLLTKPLQRVTLERLRSQLGLGM
jgi:hypothetical protein